MRHLASGEVRGVFCGVPMLLSLASWWMPGLGDGDGLQRPMVGAMLCPGRWIQNVGTVFLGWSVIEGVQDLSSLGMSTNDVQGLRGSKVGPA